ncbi:MAG: hypothetical protein ACTSYY_00795 [Promethearchaeota archaeon]
MTEEKKDLYYCSECMHVYYKIPSDHQCAICHNQMHEEDKISYSALDILTCETCHSLYTAQDIDDLIPKNIQNDNFLCACKHHCPTNALLQIGKEEAYIGNIVLADIYNCTNCGAISYRNSDNQQRKCTECGSRFVIPLNWDSKSQKTFFSCANKQSHGIRLKIRDLILNNNQIIFEEIKKIRINEEQLQNQYNKRKEEIIQNYEKKNIIQKISKRQSKLEKELNLLNEWAIEKRRELYKHLQPKALRCSVFKMEKNNDKIIYTKTKDGCGALAHLKIRKIIFAPDGTVIDRAPPKPEEPIIETSEKLKVLPTASSDVVLKKTPMSPLIEKLNQTELFEKLSFFKNLNDIADSLDDSFKNLPELTENQIYIKIFLYSTEYLSNIPKKVNSGVIPIRIKNEDFVYKIGREQFIKAYWYETEFFNDYPLIFNSVIPNSKNSAHFQLELKSGEFLIAPGKNSINKIFYSTIEENSKNMIELTESTPLKKIRHLFFESYYPFDRRKIGMDHRFIFRISISVPIGD